ATRPPSPRFSLRPPLTFRSTIRGELMLSVPLIISSLWLLISALSLFNTIHAFRPSRHRLLFVPSFFSSWLVLELPGHHIVLLALGALAVILLGGASELLGQIALVLNAISIVFLFVHIRNSQRARHVLTDALKGYIDDS